MPVAPLCARAMVTGAVIKRRLKRVNDFFILMPNRNLKDLDFQCMITLDVGVNVKITTQ